MSIREFINFKKLQHALIYIVIIVVALNLQGSLLNRFQIFGVSPMIIPALIVAIGMFENGVWGGILGIFAGIFCDIAATDHVILYTVLLAVCGLGSGMLTQLVINRHFWPYLIAAAIALFLPPLFQAIGLWMHARAGFWLPIFVAVLQMVLSLPFAAAIYPLCSAISAQREKD